VAQVVNYVIFAEPANDAAKQLQASTFEQLGYGAESGVWRNFYLMGAYELRNGSAGTPAKTSAPAMLAALTVDQIFDALALRVDGPRAWHEKLVSDWHFTDKNRLYRVELRNGVLIHYDRPAGDRLPPADVTVTLTRSTLTGVLLAGRNLEVALRSGAITIDGDARSLVHLTGLFDNPDPDFAIVTP
jgi:alkyl sulfatase BDS1-like metallo-beta-lactamase superfamily hydrolase